MASNSEANLSSDFDIDEVINWDDNNYSSKDISFQLPSLGLPNDVKSSQNSVANHSSLVSTVVSTQQTTLPGTQNTSSSLYTSLFGTAGNAATIRNSKNHGFSSQQAMVSPPGPAFPSESFDIPPITPPSSRNSLLQFSNNLVGQNATALANHIHAQQLQTVQQNQANLLNESVSPFTDDAMGDGDDFIEGPLDKIVDQIMARELNDIIKTSPLSNTYAHHATVTTTNMKSQLSPPSPSILQNVTSSVTQSVPTIQSGMVPVSQKSIPAPSQSKFVLHSSGSARNLGQTMVAELRQNIPQTADALQSTDDIVELLGIQGTVGCTVSKADQNQTRNKLTQSTSVLTSTFLANSIIPPASSSAQPAVQAVPVNVNLNRGVTQNDFTRSQTGISSKVTFVTSVNNSSSTKLASPVTSTLNIQRNLPHQSSLSVTLPSTVIAAQNLNVLRSVVQQTKPITNAVSEITSQGLHHKRSVGESSNNLLSSVSTSQNSNIQRTLAQNTSAIVASSVITTPGLNNKRTVAQQPTGHFSLENQTTSPNISRTGGNTGINSMQMSPQNLNRTPRVSSVSLSKQGAVNLPSHLGVSQPQSSSPKATLIQENVISRTSQLNNNYAIASNANNLNTTKLQPALQKQIVSDISQAQISPSNTGLTHGNMATSTSHLVKNFAVSNLPKMANRVLSPLNIQKQSVSNSSHLISTSTASGLNQVTPATASAQSIAATALKISSPSTNIVTGFQQPVASPTVSSQQTVLSLVSPQLRTTNSLAAVPTSLNPQLLSKIQLNQGNLRTGSNTSNPSRVVFTVAPGSQRGQSLKALSISGGDKLAGRQVFLLQQPGQVIDKSKPQPVKIIFVNDGSIRQFVSGPQKLSVQSSSAVLAKPESPVQTAIPGTTFSASSTHNVHALPSAIPETSEGSPSSVKSDNSDSLPVVQLKQTESVKKDEIDVVVVEKKKRGTKRRKDPNKPVKPLSSFQRFFQKTQVGIRQQAPDASFAEVTKIAKQMWEGLGAKDKKVYQDAWRMERIQYKKALEEYQASLGESEVVEDGPVPKQQKNDQSSSPVPVSPIDVPSSNIVPSEASSPPTPSMDTSVPPPVSASIMSSPSSAAPVVISNPAPAAPRGSGKPLAMMVELANKNKLASEQGSGKTLGTVKASSLTKTKGSSNGGVHDDVPQVTKKKTKINPIPRKSCVRKNCGKFAKPSKERGNQFCSNDCVMLHCRGIFKLWVDARRASLKAAAT